MCLSGSHKSLAGVAILLILPLSVLVSSRLLWRSNPDYMRMEFYGLAYDGVPLGALCDPNPLTGLEGPMSNVTDQRSFSLIYAVPNKLFYGRYDLFTVQRIMSGTFYVLILVLLALTGAVVGLGFWMMSFVVVYYGASEQLLSYLFEYKLTLTSVVWLCAALLLFGLLVRARERASPAAYGLLPLMPFTAVVSYETYCVSRPLALVYWLFGWLWVLGWRSRRRSKLGLGAVYAVSSLLAWRFLKFLHPRQRFNLSLFEGRNESVALFDASLRRDWLTLVKDRLSELHYLWRWPNHSLFISESTRECGWLEIWLALAVLGICLGAILLLRKERAAAAVGRPARWEIFLWLVLMGTALCVPLLSRTFVRGHRFFGLYLTSVLLTAALGQSILNARLRWLGRIVIACGVMAIAATLVHRVPLIREWQTASQTPEPNLDSRHLRQMVADLRTLGLPPEIAAKKVRYLDVCDLKQPQIWAHSWHAALYVSGFGCRSGAQTMIFWGEGCDCREILAKRGAPSICLSREYKGGENFFQIMTD